MAKRAIHSKRRDVATSGLDIELSKGSDRPLFVQLQQQIVERIASGELMPGMRLPPVRLLARQLGINQMTVAKAYKDLAEAGFVEGRGGGGTHVRAPNGASAKPAGEEVAERPLLSERLYELSHAPGVIAFTSNFPTPDEACMADFKNCLSEVIARSGNACFHYDPPTGRLALREAIAAYLEGQDIAASAEDIVIASGAQQGIDLVVRMLVPPGAPVIIERPAYYGIINALRAVRARILEVPLQGDGMNLEVLEEQLARHRPRLIYTNPTFQNPTGISTSEEKRRAVLALARKHGVAILEDDHSSELRFAGRPLPAIRALAGPDDPVFFVRGFGKTILPGTRIGYVVAPPASRRSLLATKAHADLHSNGFMQEAMALFLARRSYPGILERMRKTFGAKQRMLFDALSKGMPPGTLIDRPEGGLSLWLTLPEGTEVSELYYRAVRRGVAFVSGEVFYASRVNPRTLRVSFGLVPNEVLADGVSRLCSVATDLLRPRSALSPIFT